MNELTELAEWCDDRASAAGLSLFNGALRGVSVHHVYRHMADVVRSYAQQRVGNRKVLMIAYIDTGVSVEVYLNGSGEPTQEGIATLVEMLKLTSDTMERRAARKAALASVEPEQSVENASVSGETHPDDPQDSKAS